MALDDPYLSAESRVFLCSRKHTDIVCQLVSKPLAAVAKSAVQRKPDFDSDFDELSEADDENEEDRDKGNPTNQVGSVNVLVDLTPEKKRHRVEGLDVIAKHAKHRKVSSGIEGKQSNSTTNRSKVFTRSTSIVERMVCMLLLRT